jgi:hypothetical protein
MSRILAESKLISFYSVSKGGLIDQEDFSAGWETSKACTGSGLYTHTSTPQLAAFAEAALPSSGFQTNKSFPSSMQGLCKSLR